MRLVFAAVMVFLAVPLVAQDATATPDGSASVAVEGEAAPSVEPDPAADSVLLAQTAAPDAQKRNSDVDVLPLPIASPQLVHPGGIEPLTARGKARLAWRNTFSLRAMLNRAMLTGINHWQDSPEEWPGNLEGYGMRFGSRIGRLAVRNAIQLSVDVALKTDPRYDRCDCVGFRPRTLHALKRVVVARRDDGGQIFHFSRMAGAYVTPMVTDQWYPDRLNTWGHKMSSGTNFLAFRVLNHMIKEFWPDIRRKVRIRGVGEPD